MNAYNEQFSLEDGVLHVRLAGTFPAGRLSRSGNVFQPLIDACTELGCTMALIDARELRVDLGTTGLFQAGQDAARAARMGLRIALLARPDMVDPFFDDVTRNRGAEIGIFMHAEAALDWLRRGAD